MIRLATSRLRNLHIFLALLFLASAMPPVAAQDDDGARNRRTKGRRPADNGPVARTATLTKLRLSKGKIPVKELMGFVSKVTGNPVIYPSAPTPEAQFSKDIVIDVLADIDPVTLPIVKSLLAGNGYSYFEVLIEDGSTVICFSHQSQRQRSAIPIMTGIYAAKNLPKDLPSDRLVTVIASLRHLDTSMVIGALRDLLGVTGRGGPATVSIVSLSAPNKLCIRGRVSVLRHVLTLIDDLDTPAPDRTMGVIEVHHVLARDAAGVMVEFMGKRRFKAVGDNRSGKIFIQAASPAALEIARKIAIELDVKEAKHPEVKPQQSEEAADSE